MADLQKTIEIIFAGENRTSASVQSVARDLDTLQSSVGDITGPLANLSSTILTTEASALALGAAFIGVAVNEAGQFKESVAEIGTLFNGTADQVGSLEGQILDFSRGSVSSIEEINGAVYQAISTGTDWNDAISLVAETEKLAVAGRADLVEVTKLVAGAMNAYGAATSEAADYSDVLFAAVQKGQTTMPELTASLGQVTGIAAAAQVPFDDLAAALAALTIYTGNTSESTTKLKAIFTELLKPSDELTAALDGVTVQGDGLDAVFAKLYEATGGNAQAMAELFGSVEALQGALALANDNAGRYADAQDAMAERTGIVVNAYDNMVEQLSKINQKLINNITATLAEFGGPLLDDYRDIAEQLGKVFEAISPSVNPEAFKPIYDELEALSADLTEFLKGVAEALPEALSQVDFRGLLDALGLLREEFGSIFEGLDLTKPEDLAIAVQFIVDSFESLTRVSAGIADKLAGFVRWIGEMIVKVNESDDAFKTFVGEVLGLSQIVNTLLPILGYASDALNGLSSVVLTLAGAKYLGATTAGFASMAAVIATNPASLIAAVGGASIVLGDFAADVFKLSGVIDENRQSTENWTKAFAETSTWEEAVVRAKELGENVGHLNEVFIESYGVAATTVAHYGSIEAGLKAMETASNDYVSRLMAQNQAQEDAGAAAAETAKDYDAIVEAVSEQTKVADLATESTKELTEAFRLMSLEERAALSTDERELYVAAIEKTYAATDQAADSTREMSQAELEAQVTAQEVLEIRLEQLKATQDYQLALEKLASDERLQAMEFVFKLNLAEIESDTEKAVAIIDTINTAIESTGQLLGELFGFLTNDDLDFSTKWAIERQIELENQRRQEALDLQKKLTEALIDQMEARTAALENGDGLITIQADGLEPEIEAFMFKIIEKIHIKAIGDQSQFLLGI
ncbi:phage tail tape measure protein [Marinobacterium aestuariivivens]|uniref:Phage tail tape measure protein n=1 Tax=Marinobacterium aestuariivivens TaxID=1698799 RepID=A0ABW2A535_9GAMM